jgi:hypothetical protein
VPKIEGRLRPDFRTHLGGCPAYKDGTGGKLSSQKKRGRKRPGKIITATPTLFFLIFRNTFFGFLNSSVDISGTLDLSLSFRG